MIDQKILDRANAAKRLKENPDFVAVMAAIEDDIFQGFRSVNIGDDETLKHIHQTSHGFNLFVKKLDKYIEIAIFEASKDESF